MHGVLQHMIEGGARLIASFRGAGLVDRYVLYVAPALFGGATSTPAIAGRTESTIDVLWRGRFAAVERVGDDVRLEIVPTKGT